MKYFLVPLGCQMNQSDAERIRAVLEAIGYEAADCEEDAILLGVVACSVRQKAIDRVYGRVRKWQQWKAKRDIVTFISGCMLPTDESRLRASFDVLFPVTELTRLPGILRRAGLTPIPQECAAIPDDSLTDAERGFWRIAPRYSSDHQAFVPIQNGCDKLCSFCAVPYTRGREVSRPRAEVLAEVRSLVDRGYKSITLLGQNVNSYGRFGRSTSGFAQLIDAIGQIGDHSAGEFWVYFTSPHPQDMTEDVLRTVADHKCLAEHIHLPLQSGDDQVLQRMNRNYAIADYRRVVASIRRILPAATLTTDLIVGFPGETPQQFENTRSAMQEFQFNMAYIAMYSPRPGAASYRWHDDVPVSVKKQRLHTLSGQLQKQALAYNQRLIGNTLQVLVDGHDRKPGHLSARAKDRTIVRFPEQEQTPIGSFTFVTVTSAAPLSVAGSVCRLHQ